jgi:hypothetical protein
MLPADYEPVDLRIHRFYDKHPDGRILTDLHDTTRNSDGSTRQYIFRAEIYRDRTSVLPDSVGFAEETVGVSTGPRASLLETCETSAIGRALANLGFSPKGFRPSQEEMQKASRHSHPASQPARQNNDEPNEPNPFHDDQEPQPKYSKPVGVATEKQIAFAKSLAKKKGYAVEIDPTMSVRDMALFIDHLKTMDDIK